MVTEEQVLDRIRKIEEELRQLRKEIYESEIFVTDTENKAIKRLSRHPRA